MADLAATGTIEQRDDAGKTPDATVRFWLQQLGLAEKEDKDYVKKGRLIVQRYRDERRGVDRNEVKFNILWANVQTLMPILYARAPKPDVSPRHRDNADAPTRMGAEILQRCLAYEDDIEEFDDVMNRVVEDRLLPGRGVARVFYEPEFGDPKDDPDGEPDEDGKVPQISLVTSERAPVRYVFWEDYRESPARNATEVTWKAYRSYLRRDELVKRFGAKIGKAVNLDYTPKGVGEESEKDGPLADAFKKAVVWEIWDKTRKETVWIATGYDQEPLDTKSDPLELPGFFPSPTPLSATQTNEKSVPVADYTQYQDQAAELDTLTGRIDRLTSSLRVAGVYAASEKATLQQLVEPGGENILIPAEDWAMFAEKGGVQGMISWLPIEQIAKVLLSLYDARDRAQRVLYQITGIADILRGETNPTETLGAQQLKGQFATRRISKAQKDVARFARDLMRLRANVVARHFSPETLADMSGLPETMPPLPPPPEQLVPMPAQQPMERPMGDNIVPHPAVAA